MKKADEKIKRVIAALNRQEPDRVPAGEFFWGGFLEACKVYYRKEDFDPYRFFDLDLIVITPNMDPHIKQFEIIKQDSEKVIVKTGFEATIMKKFKDPMPAFLDFGVKTTEDTEKFTFDSPRDDSRFFKSGDDQINGVGDGFVRNIPSFMDRVNAYAEDFCIFGSVCEPYEYLWRVIGSENALLKIGLEQGSIEKFVKRIGNFLAEFIEKEIKISKGILKGIYIWGDIAYKNGLLFHPNIWRKIFLPQLVRLVDIIHGYGLKVIYHGCGNVNEIFSEMIESGIDAYNPLEFKAGIDVLELKKKFGDKISFNGNIDVSILAKGDKKEIKEHVLTRLNAGKGGGYIFQSDHSVPSDVSPESYEYALKLVRKYGYYPLNLGEYNK